MPRSGTRCRRANANGRDRPARWRHQSRFRRHHGAAPECGGGTRHHAREVGGAGQTGREGGTAMSRLGGRIALVTGAGSGLGRATAKLFAAEGAHVYVTDSNGPAAASVVEDILGTGASAQAITTDVTRGLDVTAMFRAVESTHGRLDVLVNNAGLNVRGDFRHLSDAEWVKIREVNLDGVVRVARDGFALLRASGR